MIEKSARRVEGGKYLVDVLGLGIPGFRYTTESADTPEAALRAADRFIFWFANAPAPERRRAFTTSSPCLLRGPVRRPGRIPTPGFT